jgi:hypothetical protein
VIGVKGLDLGLFLANPLLPLAPPLSLSPSLLGSVDSPLFSSFITSILYSLLFFTNTILKNPHTQIHKKIH